MDIFDKQPELRSYIAKFMDETGCDFNSACDELGINITEENTEE